MFHKPQLRAGMDETTAKKGRSSTVREENTKGIKLDLQERLSTVGNWISCQVTVQ